MADTADGERRFKLRFRSREGLMAALAMENPYAEPIVVNEKRAYVSFAAPAALGTSISSLGETELLVEGLSVLAHEFDGEIVEDYQYQIDQGQPDILALVPTPQRKQVSPTSSR